MPQFCNDYQVLIEAATRNGKPLREPAWSESIAVGSTIFIEKLKEKLIIKAQERKLVKNQEDCILKEPQSSYKADFAHHMGLVSFENMHHWELYNNISSV